MRLSFRFVPLASLACLLAACANSPRLAAPETPAALAAPGGASPFLETFATGVQVYECTRKPDSSFEWAFKAPVAALSDRSGRLVGEHYAGPTWKAADGSTIAGEVKARDPGPTPSAIPWLLLSAKSNSGPGIFADAKFVQRVATVGGLAPAGGCTESTLKHEAHVPYTASYFFYR